MESGELFNLETSTLSEEERTTLIALLDEFQDVYSRGANDLGKTSKVYHKIPTGDARPIKQGARRLPYHQREVEKNLDAMVKNGVVTPSSSPWSSPIVLVKKDGTTRFCVDCRKLNDITRKDAYSLPWIDETLDALGGAAYFSTMENTDMILAGGSRPLGSRQDSVYHVHGTLRVPCHAIRSDRSTE